MLIRIYTRETKEGNDVNYEDDIRPPKLPRKDSDRVYPMQRVGNQSPANATWETKLPMSDGEDSEER
jgi:hypothetical protein